MENILQTQFVTESPTFSLSVSVSLSLSVSVSHHPSVLSSLCGMQHITSGSAPHNKSISAYLSKHFGKIKVQR